MRVCLIVGLLAASAAFAQDSRNVVEPKIPADCAILTAEIAPQHGALTDIEERMHRDNTRIEQGMAKCAPGKAVVLRAGKTVAQYF